MYVNAWKFACVWFYVSLVGNNLETITPIAAKNLGLYTSVGAPGAYSYLISLFNTRGIAEVKSHFPCMHDIIS